DFCANCYTKPRIWYLTLSKNRSYGCRNTCPDSIRFYRSLPLHLSAFEYRAGTVDGYHGVPFIFTSLSTAFMFMIVAVNLYPNLLFSTLDPEYHITIYNAAASEKTLGIMLLMAAIGTPLVITYTTIVYYTFRGKVKMDETSY